MAKKKKEKKAEAVTTLNESPLSLRKLRHDSKTFKDSGM